MRFMESDHESSNSEAEASQTVDRSVAWILAGLGVLLAFGLILSTFSRVNQFTRKPYRSDAPQAEHREAEIGGVPGPAARR